MKLTILTFLSICCLSAVGQTDYLVTLKGDTLYGKIFISSIKSVDEITVKGENENTMVSANLVDQIIIKEQLYKPVSYENTKRMALFFEEGFLSHIAIKLDDGGQYDHQLLYKETGEYLAISNFGFKKHLSTFLSECNSFVAGLESGNIKTNKTSEVVRFYNESCRQAGETKVATVDIIFFSALLQRIQNSLDKGQGISSEDYFELMKYKNSDLNVLFKRFLDSIEKK